MKPKPNKIEEPLPDVLGEIETAAEEVHKLVEKHGRSVFARYPLTFALLSTFGIAAVIYGFEATIRKIPFLVQWPELVLIGGLVILLFTGSLYKYLRK